MYKLFIIAASVASILTGAMTIAGAGNTVQSISAIDVQTAQVTAAATDCELQVWPQISSQCLVPVSDEGTVRSARIIF